MSPFRLSCLLCCVVLCWAVLGASAASGKDIDKPAPGFALEVMQGTDSGTLEALRGKVVIVEFWATYCGWCKKTHPKLASFAAQHSDAVAILGITAQKKSRVERYLRKTKTGITVLHDPRARVSRSYRAQVTPTLVVIDKDGTIRSWSEGGNTLKATLELATSLLNKPEAI